MFGIVVKPGGNSKVIIKEVSDLKLNELYRLTDCDCIAIGSIETALLDKLGCKLGLVYDDEFLIRDGEKVINKLCSYLYGYDLHGECLCGKVAIVKFNEIGNDFIPFTMEEAYKFKKLLENIAVRADKKEYVLHQPYFEILGAEEAKSRHIFNMLVKSMGLDNEGDE